MSEDITKYTYSGVMGWMENEWRSFHREREEWANEKAVLVANVNHLQRLLRSSEASEAALNRKITTLETLTGTSASDIRTDEGPSLGKSNTAVGSIDSLKLPLTMDVPDDDEAVPLTSKHSVVRNDSLLPLSEDSPPSQAQPAWSSTSSDSPTSPALSSSSGISSGTVIRSRRQSGGSPSEPIVKPMTAEEVGPGPPPKIQQASPTPKTYNLRASLRGHFAAIRCACWCGEGTLMLTGGDDHVVKLWDARRVLKGKDREEPVLTFRGHTSPVVSLASHREEVVAGGFDGSIRIWRVPGTGASSDAPDQRSQNTNTTIGGPGGITMITQHTDAVWGLSVQHLQDGTHYIATAGCDQRMLLFHRSSGDTASPSPEVQFPTIKSMTSNFTPIHCHVSDTRYTVSYRNGDNDSNSGIAVYSIAGSPMWDLPISSRPTALRVHGNVCAVGTSIGRIITYDLYDGVVTGETAPHTAAVTSVAFANDFILSAAHDEKVHLLDSNKSSSNYLNLIQTISTSHGHRLGECLHVVLYHTGRGIIITTGADSWISWYTNASKT
eukprot:TRINITY_DN1491_c0_g1_i1.p1 TRINITY_DN1491_c0_g1~~TRINITY_DN1491_c0_g1_i1.p1  ORF type:complete len:573 (+),score=99.33 TRINITY_DN1491_c0_g1_i1:66-1721(+)